MEAGLIVRRECTDERAYAVRIGEREGLVVHQAAYEIDGPGAGDGCLYDEPFVEHERVVAVTLLESGERLPRFAAIRKLVCEHGKSRCEFRHAARLVELARGR